MRRRGENVSSMELEARDRQAHPGIAEVAVHAVAVARQRGRHQGVHRARRGEPPDPEELFAFFRDNLPYFAVPRYVELVAALPKNAVGRVLKHQLRSDGVNDNTIDLQAQGFTVSVQDRRK